MTEEAQHRHHAVDGIEQRGRRRNVAGGEHLPQRQQVEQQLDQCAGIAADVAAIGKDLPLQLVAEPLGGAADMARLVGHAERGISERDDRLQPRQAVARRGGGMTQQPYLPREAAQEAPVEAQLRIVEHQR